ncbi:RICIN domain-containing protein [Streptomyces inhibens]|uniref:RICIN domain-containing protein n=1 Tax=Streptomyces inhibens TaxID=2293571 RepID=UPI00402AF124
MSLAVGASPLATGTAYADDDTAISQLSITPSEPQGAHGPMQLAIGPDDGWAVVDNELPHGWRLLPNKDGSFAIRLDPLGKCVDVNNDDYLARVPCDPNSGKQNWYLQGNGGDGYRIRNVSNNKCMDVREVRNNGRVGIWDCGSGKANQIWHLSPARPDAPGPTVADLATAYALKQCSDKSGFVKSCHYEVTADSTATVGDLKHVSEKVFNYTTSPSPRTLAWKQTTSETDTVGGSITITAKGGFDIKMIKVEVSQAITAHYSHNWTRAEEVSDASTITVNPNQYSWAMRGQLMKTVTGDWTFTNDLGETWKGNGTATVPAEDGTDSQKSSLVLCTSDSDKPECVNSRW